MLRTLCLANTALKSSSYPVENESHKGINCLFSPSCLRISSLFDDSEIELYLRGINWRDKNKNRTIIYNLTVPLVKNNVDLCLFNLGTKELEASKYALSESYLALGELKGGIDPAGADEHWKTAGTALQRIQRAFSKAKNSPQTFFVGAAIEKKMAEEIWNQLKDGTISNAANLNDDRQVASVSRWLCNL